MDRSPDEPTCLFIRRKPLGDVRVSVPRGGPTSLEGPGIPTGGGVARPGSLYLCDIIPLGGLVSPTNETPGHG